MRNGWKFQYLTPCNCLNNQQTAHYIIRIYISCYIRPQPNAFVSQIVKKWLTLEFWKNEYLQANVCFLMEGHFEKGSPGNHTNLNTQTNLRKQFNANMFIFWKLSFPHTSTEIKHTIYFEVSLLSEALGIFFGTINTERLHWSFISYSRFVENYKHLILNY